MKPHHHLALIVSLITCFIAVPSHAATINYNNWSRSGSNTVIPRFTVSDNFEGKFKVDISIDANSPNDFAKITGVFFNLGDDIITQADITGENIGGDLAGHTHFATNASKINGVTTLNLGSFETILGYKKGSSKADAPLSFFVNDHGGSLTLDDWKDVAIRFQAVGLDNFGGGSDKEWSNSSSLIATPIPGSVWLFGSALLGLARLTKHHKKDICSISVT